MHGVHVIEYVTPLRAAGLQMQIVAAESVGRSYRCNYHYRKTHPPHLARPFSVLKNPAQPNAFVHAAIGSEGVMALHWRECKRAKFSEGDFNPI